MTRELILLLLLLPAASFAQSTRPVKLVEDAPILPPSETGTVSGVVSPAAGIRTLSAICRDTGKTYKPRSFEPKSGQFSFADLPGDSAYDVQVVAIDGRTYEGIDLDTHDPRMLRLAQMRRQQLGLPQDEQPHEFRQEDADALLKYVKDLCQKDFMDQGRVLYVQGHGSRATMLVELMRTRDFYDSAGKIIWRTELWYFEYQHGGWERMANQERVLHRKRIAPEDWKKIHIEYWPDLTARIDSQGNSAQVKFTIPEKPDPSRGRPANSDHDIPAQPHVSGLAGSTSRPAATQPEPGK